MRHINLPITLAALVALTLTAAGLSTASTAASAGACQYVNEPDPQVRLDSRLENATLIVVGDVTSEEASSSPDVFTSTIEVTATLSGNLPENPLVLDNLSEVWLCVGGPRLLEGSTVLLLLAEASTGSQGLETGPTGGVIVLSDSGATLDDYDSPLGDSSLGTNEEVIRYVASSVNAPEAETNRALASLDTQPQAPAPDATALPADDTGLLEEDEGDFRWVLPVTGGVIVVFIGLVAIIFTKAGKPRRG